MSESTAADQKSERSETPESFAEKGRRAAAAANAFRAETLYRVSTGELTVFDVLDAAVDDRRLRRMSLRSLLMADPKIGDVTARRVIDVMVKLSTGRDQYKVKQITVAWLLDQKDYGRRVEAFCEAIGDATTTAFALGFPYNPVEVSNDGPVTSG